MNVNDMVKEGFMPGQKSDFKSLELDPKFTALVIVDRENDFCNIFKNSNLRR